MTNAAQARVCILDYGSGNVRSVYNLVASITPAVVIANEAEAIRSSTHLILPGVGAFGASAAKVRARVPLAIVAAEILERRKPFLGICVGFQLLADKGYEFGEHEGLGWLGGRVDRLDSGTLPLPHIGWNNIITRQASPLLDGIRPDEDFYFVHSFAFRPARETDVAAVTEYGETFAAVASRDNVHGVQFHPEKSQRAGRQLLQNFLATG